MTRRIFKSVLRCGVGLGLLAGIASCADQQEPINRVQADALDKHFFLGASLADAADDPEFHWRGYVIDGSANQSAIGVGSWSHIDRIRWEATENMLIARKSYPLFDQDPQPGTFAGTDSDGAVVAIYQIKSHFDIRRAYNSQTGEEMNVIEENMTDRPWNEREFMRVDWSTNKVNDPMWMDMFFANVFGDISVSPLTYNVTDPRHKDAPHFEPKDGYFDITNRFYIEAVETPTPWGFSIWGCYLEGMLNGTATYGCDPQEATVRFSFQKIDPENDFEPLENSKAYLEVVGNPGGLGNSYSVGVVTAPRVGFDPWYRFTDDNMKLFANIHNTWKKSHQAFGCNGSYDQDQNGTDDQCENTVTQYGGSTGSVCDVNVKKCTIPYRDREIKTIGYWVNDLMPDEFQDQLDANGQPVGRGANEDIVYSWNQMMTNAVGYAREVECRRTGEGDRDACHAQFFAGEKEMVAYGGWLTDKALDPMPVVTLCHNPVRSYDMHDVCGDEGYVARTGDLRRNMLVYWPYDSKAPWGGIANWNGDPLTGEIKGAAALTMGRSVRYGAAWARDVLQVAMGDLSINDVITGVPQDIYFSPAVSNPGQKTMGLTDDEIASRTRAVDAKHAMQFGNIKPLAGDTLSEKMSAYAHSRATMHFDSAAEASDLAAFDSIAAPFLDTKFENDMMGPSWTRNTLGTDGGMTADQLPMASPLRMLDPGKLRMLTDTVRTRMEAKGACFLDHESPLAGSVDIPGLAKHYLAKYADLDPVARGQAIYNELVVETYKGIAIHEMGHSLGMLHQFASSWDATNYQPQYWQLRTGEGTTAGPCTEARDPKAPDTCLGPRYLDPENPDEMGLADESRPGINYFASTSTMEYQWERFGESAGLGTYDQYTMKALYGRVLETQDDRIMPVAEQERFGPRMRSQLNEQEEVIRTTEYGTFPQPLHYTELARQMKIFDSQRDCRPATDEEKAQAQWRIVHGLVCAPTPRDHAAWRDFVSDLSVPGDGDSAAPFWHTPADPRFGGGQVRWFHRWGSTSNAYIHTNPSDAGADPYEAAVNTRRKFDARYAWAYFRRQSREFDWMFLPNAIARRYFDLERTYNWHATSRAAQFYASFGPERYDEMAKSDDWLRPYLMASTESFNMLARSVLMPQPGPYYASSDRKIAGHQKNTIYDTDDYPGSMSVKAFDLTIGDGRFIDDDMNSGPDGGGSWKYQEWMNRAGFEVEKAYAIAMITDGRPPVYTPNRDLFLDPRSQRLSFYATMPHAVDRLIGGVLSEDWETIGMHYVCVELNPLGGGCKSGELRMLDITQPDGIPARPAAGQILFPNIGFRQQSIAAILAGIYSRHTGDMTLLNKMRIWIDGVDGTIGTTGFPNPDEQVRFYNPQSGLTYIARRYGNETLYKSDTAGNDTEVKQYDTGIGARMLEFANWIMAYSYKVERDPATNLPIFDEFAQVKLLLNGTCSGGDNEGANCSNTNEAVCTGTDAFCDVSNAQPQLYSADPANTKLSTFIKYVGHVDGVRQIGLVLGAGPL